LQYMGSLQCEAGRADEGLMRLRLAYELDPGMSASLYEIARCSALRGQREDFRRAIERMMAYPFLQLPTLLLRVRVAAWMGDREELQRCRAGLREEPAPLARNAEVYAATALGEIDSKKALETFDAMLAGKASPRFTSMVCQIAAEVLCLAGDAERALVYLQRAADTALIDLEWMDRCRVLAPLRALPGFTEARLKVRTRVEAIWTM
jgi:hypothetical protein